MMNEMVNEMVDCEIVDETERERIDHHTISQSSFLLDLFMIY